MQIFVLRPRVAGIMGATPMFKPPPPPWAKAGGSSVVVESMFVVTSIVCGGLCLVLALLCGN